MSIQGDAREPSSTIASQICEDHQNNEDMLSSVINAVVARFPDMEQYADYPNMADVISAVNTRLPDMISESYSIKTYVYQFADGSAILYTVSSDTGFEHDPASFQSHRYIAIQNYKDPEEMIAALEAKTREAFEDVYRPVP